MAVRDFSPCSNLRNNTVKTAKFLFPPVPPSFVAQSFFFLYRARWKYKITFLDDILNFKILFSYFNKRSKITLRYNIVDLEMRTKPPTTKYLLSCSFQIARGMDYLSSKKVLTRRFYKRSNKVNFQNFRFFTAIWLPEIFCWRAVESSKCRISECLAKCTTKVITRKRDR